MFTDTIEALGFDTHATAIVVRTVATCYQMCHHPDDRALIGIGLFAVEPDKNGYRFAAQSRVLHDGDAAALLGWLEQQVPRSGAIVSWDCWGPVPRRLAALTNPVLHPRICAAARETGGRWRDLPKSMTWHLEQARTVAMPCICGPAPHPDCVSTLPAALLPDPAETERAMIFEAMRGWASWTSMFGDFDDREHPARRALTAFREHAAEVLPSG